MISAEMSKKLMQISELQGKLQNIQSNNIVELDRLVTTAKIQSTDSSNRIEGIKTTDTRLRQLVNNETTPVTRSEEEISGYRDVLDLVHNQYQYIPLTSNSILAMHKNLFSFTASNWGGKFKDIDNQIINQFPDGTSEVRSNPAPAFITPELVTELCEKYHQSIVLDEIPSLLLTGAFVFDFVSIHPFRDGNGRMSRLLMLLTLYQTKYDVGKYISLERLIERTKDNYYATLFQNSINWLENDNSYESFLNYFLSIILEAYRDLENRLSLKQQSKEKSATALILNGLQSELRPLSKSKLVSLIPSYSEVSIKRALITLQSDNQIQKIGAGRATKYTLKI